MKKIILAIMLLSILIISACQNKAKEEMTTDAAITEKIVTSQTNEENIIEEVNIELDEAFPPKTIDGLDEIATHVFKAVVEFNDELTMYNLVHTDSKCLVTEVYKGNVEENEEVHLLTLGGIISAEKYLNEVGDAHSIEASNNSSIPLEDQLIKFNYNHKFNLTEGKEYIFFAIYDSYKDEYYYMTIGSQHSTFYLEDDDMVRLTEMEPTRIKYQTLLDFYNK